MRKIRQGDIVGRKSYGKDIFFVVDKIFNGYAILKGVTIRIEADAPIEDLELIEKEQVIRQEKDLEEKMLYRISKNTKTIFDGKTLVEAKNRSLEKTGKILHLDGDRRYSEKANMYYKKVGLNSIVKNVPEKKQSMVIKDLLLKYNPDILVVTGHDAMLKKSKEYNNMYNYKNSIHFVNTVKKAREYNPSSDELVIFAGACQSFFEALIYAGANFASSPARILIDFMDPIVVAERVAVTPSYRYVTIQEILPEIREGQKGVGGTRGRGKMMYL